MSRSWPVMPSGAHRVVVPARRHVLCMSLGDHRQRHIKLDRGDVSNIAYAVDPVENPNFLVREHLIGDSHRNQSLTGGNYSAARARSASWKSGTYCSR